MNNKSFYITTTLPYVNARLHLGHALEFVRADTIARYKKLNGYTVFLNTGTDEHGLKIFEKAQESGLPVQDFVDQNFEAFKESIQIFGIEQDLVHFIRTTDEKHIKKAQAFWQKVYDNGFIYKKNYEAKYCVGCESEKTDSDLNENGFCPDHDGIPLQIINEENYFFKYSAFTDKLLDFYTNNPHFIVPEFRFNEIKAFVERGLQDFSISRLKEKMPWGIPVPNDDAHVMYVWFDALTNYINTFDNKSDFEQFWLNGTPTQYCGKDNTRFQGAMWQAMLMAYFLDDKHCSKQIVVNGFVTGPGGVKMSKTLGNVIDPKEIVDEYGTDALRYFLLKEIASFEDSPCTMERFRECYNAGLVNGIGNLTSRILTMSSNYGISLTDEEFATTYYPQQIADIEQFDIHKFLHTVWESLSHLDEYISKNEPFKKIKINEEGAKQDVHYLLLNLFKASLAIEPMMPETAQIIQNLIKENKKPTQPLFPRKD